MQLLIRFGLQAETPRQDASSMIMLNVGIKSSRKVKVTYGTDIWPWSMELFMLFKTQMTAVSVEW